jgi:predicted membrane-bound mannosyltransferase
LRPSASRSGSWLLALLLVAAFASRLLLGVTTVWNWDEEREWIYTADLISLVPGHINTPYRVANHAAGAAYGSLGQAVLPETRLGSRIVGIVLGVVTVAVAATMAGAMGGPAAAAWTAALMAFSEYHLAVSAMALELVYYVAFGMLAVYAFWRFLETDADRWLYTTAVCLGLAYFCKEIAALLGPPLLIALIRRDGLRWLWRGRRHRSR